MGFFRKLKEGLSKTKGAFINQMNEVVKSFRRVDEDLLEELEEVMIMADMGAATAGSVIDELRDRIKTDNIRDPEEVKTALGEILAGHIGEGEPLRLGTKPSVILVIGVNGVGKTTSIGKIANNLKKEGKKVIVPLTPSGPLPSSIWLCGATGQGWSLSDRTRAQTRLPLSSTP